MAGMRHGDECERNGEQREDERQQPSGRHGRSLNLGFPHLNSLKSGGTWSIQDLPAQAGIMKRPCGGLVAALRPFRVRRGHFESFVRRPCSRKIQRLHPTSAPIHETH
jgi:hypothetical protein